MKKNTLFSLWDEKILSLVEFQNLSNSSKILSDEQLKYFSVFGILAPTSHNSVPQRFQRGTKKNSLLLLLDRTFILPQSDPDGRQAIVSLGCVVRNIELIASTYGWESKFTLLPTTVSSLRHSTRSSGNNRYTPVLELQFTPKKEQSNFDIVKMMLKRKVLRAEYNPSIELTPSLKQGLKKIANHYPNLHMHLVDNRLIMRGFGKFQEQADRFVMENQRFAQELGEWLIENDNTALPYAMRGREFGFDDAFAQHIHLGLLGKKKLLPDQIAFFAKGGKAGIDSSSAVAVITVDKDSIEQRIEAGKMYEDVALYLTRHGFFTAVHAGITEVDWVNTMFATTILHTTWRPTVVFRIGQPKRKGDAERPHSARPQVDEMWV